MIDFYFPFAFAASLWIAFSIYAWLRLDSLCDRAALAPDHSRERASLLRQIAAMAGWWLIATALPFMVADAGSIAVGMLLLTGMVLVLIAVEAKRRDDKRGALGAR